MGVGGGRQFYDLFLRSLAQLAAQSLPSVLVRVFDSSFIARQPVHLFNHSLHFLVFEHISICKPCPDASPNQTPLPLETEGELKRLGRCCGGVGGSWGSEVGSEHG